MPVAGQGRCRLLGTRASEPGLFPELSGKEGAPLLAPFPHLSKHREGWRAQICWAQGSLAPRPLGEPGCWSKPGLCRRSCLGRRGGCTPPPDHGAFAVGLLPGEGHRMASLHRCPGIPSQPGQSTRQPSCQAPAPGARVAPGRSYGMSCPGRLIPLSCGLGASCLSPRCAWPFPEVSTGQGRGQQPHSVGASVSGPLGPPSEGGGRDLYLRLPYIPWHRFG